MHGPLTITFMSVEPIRCQQQLAQILEHLDIAAFEVGVRIDVAECKLEDRRAGDR